MTDPAIVAALDAINDVLDRLAEKTDLTKATGNLRKVARDRVEEIRTRG